MRLPRPRLTATGLLTLVVAAVLFGPLLIAWPLLGHIVHLVWITTLIWAVAVLSKSRSLLWLCIGIGLTTEVLRLVPEGSLALVLWTRITDALLTSLALGFIVHTTWTEREVGLQTILGAIAGYLMLGLVWALFYGLLELSNPGAINLDVDLRFPGAGVFDAGQLNTKLVYFSFVTLTTLGYGDVTPISAGAASLAMMQAVTGQLYIAVLIARLVAIASMPSQSD